MAFWLGLLYNILNKGFNDLNIEIMIRNSVTLEKSKSFALKIINLYRQLAIEKNEYVLSKQILKSGTSIGANLTEAMYGHSEKDFLAKAYISFKECAETHYWLELLHNAGYINDEEFTPLNKDCQEILRLLSSSTKTLSQKLKTPKTSNS